ncbi:MAG: hypothetical protein ACQEQU_00565 [Spirochaetota bacterium]
MKRKLVLAILLITLTSVTAVFAAGNQENRGRNTPLLGEQIELTGTLEVTDTEVVLNTRQGSYSLSARGGRLINLDGLDGEQVTAGGYLSSTNECINNLDGHLFVEHAQSGDQEYAGFTPGSNRQAPQRAKGQPSQPLQGGRGPQSPGGTRTGGRGPNGVI